MPEHTSPYAYTLADEVVMVLRSSFPGEPRRPHHTRVGVPAWTGWAQPVAGEERLAAAGAPIEPTLQTLVLQGASARRVCEPMRVATRRVPVLPPPSRVRRGIFIAGSPREEGRELEPARSPASGFPHSTDPAYAGFRGGLRTFRLEQWVNMDW